LFVYESPKRTTINENKNFLIKTKKLYIMLCTLLPWIYGLVSALLGGLIGWYLFKNRKWIPLQQVVNDQNEAYNTLSVTHNTLNARHASVQTNLLDLQKAQAEWESRYHTLNNDHLTLSNAKRNLGIEFDNYKAEVAKTEAALESHLTEMDGLTKKREADWDAQQAKLLNDIASRDTKTNQLSSQLAGFNANYDALQQKHDTLQVSNEGYISQVGHLNHTVEDLTSDLNFEKQRVAALEASEKESHATIQGLENHVTDLTNQHATLQVAHNDTNTLVTALTTAHASEKQNWEAQKVTLTNLHNAALANHGTTVSEHSNIVNNLTDQVREAEGKQVGVNSDLQALKDQHDETLAKHENSINYYNANLAEWERKHNESKAHIQYLTEQNAGILSDHENAVNHYNSQLGEWERKHNEAQAHIKDLTEQKAITLKDHENAIVQLHDQIRDWQAKHDEKVVALSSLQNEKEQLIAQHATIVNQSGDWKAEEKEYEAQVEKLIEGIAEYKKKIKTLLDNTQKQLNDKNTAFSALTAEKNKLAAEKEAWEAEKKEAEAHVQSLMAEINDYHTKTNEYLSTPSARIKDSESQFAALNAQLTDSKTSLTNQSTELADLETYKHRYENLLAAQTSTNSLIAQLEAERNKLSSDYKALNTLYISLSSEDGNWQSQYEALQTRSRNYELLVADLEAELARLRAGGKTLVVEQQIKTVGSVKDDLEKVEGIGPKIAGLLNDAGIYTFLQLSEAKVETIKEILDNAGSRYRMHDPSTWSAQSKMAHEGRWDELKVYQVHLTGGRES